MKKKVIIIFLALICLVSSGSTALAKLSRYTYPYDISYIEWELLTMTTAWRGTSTLAAPFILENMKFDRKDRLVHIYLKGKLEQATDENLKKSIAEINSRILEKFAEFEVNYDLTVRYQLVSEDGKKTDYIEYAQGVFNNGAVGPESKNPLMSSSSY